MKICNPKSVLVLDTRPFECLEDDEKILLSDPAVEYHIDVRVSFPFVLFGQGGIEIG